MTEERFPPEYLSDIPVEKRGSIGRTSYGTVRVATPNGVFEVQRGSRPPESEQKEPEPPSTTEEQ